MSNLPTINPFVSEAQRAWMFANDPEMARRWAAVTPKGKKLPKRKRPTSNASKLRPGTISLQKSRRAAKGAATRQPTYAGRIDPTRTGGLRRQFVAALKRQFDALKVRIIKLLVDENALGITTNTTQEVVEVPFRYVSGSYTVFNYSPDQPRDYHGRFSKAGVEAGDLTRKVWKQGGFTYKPLGSRSPKSGVVVSLPREAGWETTISKKEFKAKGKKFLKNFLTKVRESIRNGELNAGVAHVGAWHDKGTGRIVLDVNEVYQNKQEAIRVGKQRKQDALFDIGTFQEIDLRPKGVKTFAGNASSPYGQRDGRGVGTAGRADTPSTHLGVANTRWQFHSDPAKLQAFQDWLRQQNFDLLQSQTQKDLWDRYIQQGFRRGAGRSFDDVRMKKLAKRRPELFSPAAQGSVKDFYAGTKDEFLQSSFGQPVAREKVHLLAERSFDELENVTADMANRISRVLVDGFVQGHHPTKIAKTMAESIDISRARAERIARTEIIRAHAEGQLLALKNLGITDVGVAVEWSTSEDNAVCKLCAPMKGVVLTVDEAAGLIPRHPNCRCAWVPANVGEDDEGQVRDAEDIEDALSESDIDLDIAPKRPKSIFNANPEGCNQYKPCSASSAFTPEQQRRLAYLGSHGRVSPSNTAGLAHLVQTLGKDVPAAVGGHTGHGLERWQSHKPLILDVYHHVRGNLTNDTSLEQFKTGLMKAHMEGMVSLHRNDEPATVHDTNKGRGVDRVDRSEVAHPGGAIFHTVSTQ